MEPVQGLRIGDITTPNIVLRLGEPEANPVQPLLLWVARMSRILCSHDHNRAAKYFRALVNGRHERTGFDTWLQLDAKLGMMTVPACASEIKDDAGEKGNIEEVTYPGSFSSTPSVSQSHLTRNQAVCSIDF